jgi:glycosyltransferase involved in cell wall biosynthesis
MQSELPEKCTMKVLIVNPFIPEYRYEVFQRLASRVNLTVLHSGSRVIKSDIKFDQIILPLRHLGPLDFFTTNLHRLFKKFDIVISDANIRHVDRNLLILNPFRRYKWIAWGIGVSASYSKAFDINKSYNFIRYFIFRKADANVFYSNYPVEKYLAAGFSSSTLFVAHNTTNVYFDESITLKKRGLLFVGTLYKQKKIYELINSYADALRVLKDILPLHIVGDGPEALNLKHWIEEKKLEDKIHLHGSVFNEKVLQGLFRTSFACISPGQAGLSVLKSMGYGVPFITRNDAITGGEVFNISNGYNGLIYGTEKELTDIIIDINENPDKYVDMGINARSYYLQSRTIDHMVDGFQSAIDYVMS